MTESGGFEPTEPQDGVDDNMFILIDPEAIPYPLTDIWSLNYAAETLRTGGENLAGEAEDMRATWLGLQAHYSAPETGTLFPKMNPVVSRGEGLESDLRTVAGALEDLAEAARTARRSLNDLKMQAQSFQRRHEDKEVWWLTKDEETDEWALLENARLKDAVNTAWSTFNEAENDCATRISALFGGPVYSSPDRAEGIDLVYGLPTDAGEREMPGFGETFYDPLNDITAWAGTEFHPSLMSFDSSGGQAVWDTVVTNALWPSAVSLVSWSGSWHPDTGWQLSPSGRLNNIRLTGRDSIMDGASLAGVHDQHGWLWETPEDGQGGGSVWDRWDDNLEASKDELWEAHTAWSRRDEDPEYSNFTIGTNAVMMTAGLPLKFANALLGLGPGGSVTTPTPSDGSFSGPDGPRSGRGPGSHEWPSNPLPDDRPGSGTPTTERFSDQLTQLQESLLDPNQYRENPPGPNGPTGPDRPRDGGDHSSPDPAPPPRDNTRDNNTPPTRPRDDGTQRGNDQDGRPTRSDNDSHGGAPDRPRSDQSPEQRPRDRRDDSSSGDQSNSRTGRGDEQQGGTRPREDQRQPEPATGSGRGDGGNQPPRDRTGTGDDGDGGNNDGSDSGDGANRTDNGNEPEQKNDQSADIVPSDHLPGGSLAANEAAGGHALERHVDVSDNYLKRRTTGDIPGAPSGRIAGRYNDLRVAEQATATALRNNEREIENWLTRDMSIPDNRRFLIEEADVGMGEIGFSLERQGSKRNPTDWIPHHPKHVNVVLIYDESLPQQKYRIHTSYPTPKVD